MKKNLGILLFASLLTACGQSASHQQKNINPLLARYCSACHAPPTTNQKHDWPTIIRRMQQHRAEHGMPLIPEQDEQALLHYLQTATP